jgi:hypothetical protein
MSVTLNFNWLGWLLSAIVLLLLFGMGAMLVKPAKLLIIGKKATGTVIGFDKKENKQKDTMVAPIVQFKTLAGEQITIQSSASTNGTSIKIGDHVTLLYNTSQPSNAQLLQWREFIGTGMLALLIIFIACIWISGMLIDPALKIGDPFNILSSIIYNCNLSPWRFPIYFMLPLAIFSCAVGTIAMSQSIVALKMNGTKVMGIVSDEGYQSERLNDRSIAGGNYVYVTYRDSKGNDYTIKRSLAKPYTRLKVGDSVAIIYPNAKPHLGVVNTWDEIYLFATAFAGFLIAFITLFVLLLNGTIAPTTGIDASGGKLKKNGIAAIATVVKADTNAELLVINIKEDYRTANKKTDDCYTFQFTDYAWRPNKINAAIKKGDKFLAYYDKEKLSNKVFVDFENYLGKNLNIKSFEEEDD